MQAMPGRLRDPDQYQAPPAFITHSPYDAGRIWAHLRLPFTCARASWPSTPGFRKQHAGRWASNGSTAVCWARSAIAKSPCRVPSSPTAACGLLARDLYLPVSWTEEASRCRRCGRFQAGFTISGVVVDADYGTNAAFRAGLERLGSRRVASQSTKLDRDIGPTAKPTTGILTCPAIFGPAKA